jgi:hypothetical protein
VRVRVNHFTAPVSDYSGHFLASDAALDHAWYSSAYTRACGHPSQHWKVDREGRFGNAQAITADGRVALRDIESEASSGRRRERVVVWTSSHGGVFAAVADLGQRRFGPPHRLAGDGAVHHTSVVYESGPRERVIVAWLNHDETVNTTIYTP